MKRHTKAFTLVELIIVIAVIGVLAAILIPVFSNVVEKANAKSALSDARNTVEQAIIEAAENRDFPQNLVIFVKKAGNWYVYGYNIERGGKLQVSEGNPYKGYASIAALNAAYGWSGTDEPQPNGSYDLETDGAFYLVPSADRATSSVRGIPTRDLQSGMGDYTDVTELYMGGTRMGNDTAAYHGVLLNGTWGDEDTVTGGSGGSGESSTTNYTVTVNAGNLPSEEWAKFEAKCGTQSADFSGGTATLTVAENTLVNTISVEKKQGAATSHWRFDGFAESTSMVTSDTTLTAGWTELTYYTLTFDADGATLNLSTADYPTDWANSGDEVLEGTNIHDLLANSTATKGTQTHIGWKVNDGETIRLDAMPTTVSITENTTVKPVFEQHYNVTFTAGEGSGDSVVKTAVAGVNFTFPGIGTGDNQVNFTAPAGKEFKNWHCTTTTMSDINAGGAIAISQDLTFEAVWETPQFTIKYYSGSTHIEGHDETHPVGSPTATLNNGSYFSGNFSGTSTRIRPEWKKLTGYSLSTSASDVNLGAAIDTSDTTVFYSGAEIIVTAKWAQKSGSLTFADHSEDMLMGGMMAPLGTVSNMPSTAANTIAALSDSNKTIAIPNVIPHSTMDVFVYWMDEYDATSMSYTFYAPADSALATAQTHDTFTFVDEQLTSDETVLLAAMWFQECSITYYANNGSTGSASQHGVEPAPAANANHVIEANMFTYADHAFTGWNTKADGSGTSYAPGANYTCSEYLKLYAQWSVNYTITYKANGSGQADQVVDLGNNGSGTTIAANPFTYAGHNFTGWNTNAGGTGTGYDVNDPYTAQASLTLYAQWEEIPAGPSYTEVYYFGGTYRDSSDKLQFAATPSDDQGIPLNILSSSLTGYNKDGNTITYTHTLPDGSNTITRTFTKADPEVSYVNGGKKYIKFVETGLSVSGYTAVNSSNLVSTFGGKTGTISTNYYLTEDVVSPSGTFKPCTGNTNSSYYSGMLDGMGYAVVNLTITNPASSNSSSYQSVGFFGYAKNAKISNFYLVNETASITTSFTFMAVGGLAAHSIGSTFNNCHNSGTIRGYATADAYAGTGGLIGLCKFSTDTGTTSLTNCTSSATVTVQDGLKYFTGGLLGRAIQPANFTNCGFYGNITEGGLICGGIAGYLADTSANTFLTNCEVRNATITSTGTKVTNMNLTTYKSNGNGIGGLVGISNARMTRCRAYGSTTITAQNFQTSGAIGGLVGAVSTLAMEFTECWSCATINAGLGATGQIVGYYSPSKSNSSAITNCWSGGVINKSGTLSSTYPVGGIIGNSSPALITNCYSFTRINLAAASTYAHPVSGYTTSSTSYTNVNAYFYANSIYVGSSTTPEAVPDRNGITTSTCGFSTLTGTGSLMEQVSSVFSSTYWETDATTGYLVLKNNKA